MNLKKIEDYLLDNGWKTNLSLEDVEDRIKKYIFGVGE